MSTESSESHLGWAVTPSNPPPDHGTHPLSRLQFWTPRRWDARLPRQRPAVRGRRPLKPPLYLSRVSAGFANPADDHVDPRLDLNEYCVRNPAATHLAEVEGDSIIEAGICPGDVVVVGRLVDPKDGDIVVAALNGEMAVKRLRLTGKNGGQRAWLVSANEAYAPIEVCEGHELVVWGIVTHVIRKCR